MPQLFVESFYTGANGIEPLSDWIFETILPYIKDRVLEIDSGSGAIASRLLEKGFTVQLNASSEDNRTFLREKFKETRLVRGIHRIGFLNPRMETKYIEFQGRFSTVIAIGNIAEQSYYDSPALKKASRFLRIGGHFVIMGRCSVSLFPNSEEDFSTLKKYNYKHIKDLLSNCEPLIVRFFELGGLCFIAVGKKFAT